MIKRSNRSRARELLSRVRRFPSAGNLPELYDELENRPNVIGCYVGLKTVGGKTTRKRSIVCAVKKKLPERRLKSASDCVPRRLAWNDASGKRHEVPTDVVEASGKIEYQSPFAGPGDDLLAGNGEFACLGLALLHPTLGRVVTTAGHALRRTPGIVEFLPSQAPRVRISSFRGSAETSDATVLKIHLTDKSDYALLRPADGVSCANLYRDATVLSRPYIPGPGDLGREVLVLGASAPLRTIFRGVSANFLNHPAGMRMNNLLVTDQVTQPGDSGACLADVNNGDLRVWGLLVGAATLDGRAVSVFTSALAPILLEQAEFLA